MIDGLKPYSTMKNSGVEWLGNVPTHWQMRRLKTLCSMKSGDSITEISIEPAGQYPVYGGNGIRGYASSYTHNGKHVLIGRQGALCGNVHIARGQFWASEHAVVATPCPGHIIEWFSAILGAMNLNQYSISAAQPGLSVERVLNLSLPVPTPREQAAIVRFLDHADRRIRRYIRAKERLMALLEEQKQAIIHQAVMGRIDVRTGRPYPAYTSSGVEWLSDLPAHWEVRRLRNVADTHFSNVDKHSNHNEYPVRLCNYSDVYYNDRIHAHMDFMKATATADEIERFRLSVGDVIITKDSEAWDDIGVSALVESTDRDLVCGYHLALLRPIYQRISGEFLQRILSYRGVAIQFFVRANGVTRFGLPQTAIKSIWLPIAPPPEQAAIVDFLGETTTKADNAITRARRQIELLREYRSRLIADVVTGKLDVRAAAAALPEEPDGPDAVEGDYAEAKGGDGDRPDCDRRTDAPTIQEGMTL